MGYYLGKHRHTCGADLHGNNLYLCILDPDGQTLFHRRVPCDEKRLLSALAPFRDDLVIGVECMFKWYWLADFCSEHGIKFLLGHALDMKAVHGAKTGNDRIDAERIARLVLGLLFPMGYVYPREMRSTRDLLRRRAYCVRQRTGFMNHTQNTNIQYNLPPLGKIDHPTKRENLETRFSDPAVRTSIEVNLSVIDTLDAVISKLEKATLKAAKGYDRRALNLLKTVYGIGDIIAMTLLFELHDINRFDSVGDFLSYCCLVKCDKTSNGKFKGTGCSKRGNHFLKWAFSEAAALFLRANPAGQKLYSRLVKKHGKGKAMGVLAAKLGRAVFFMLQRNTVFDINCLVRN